MKSRFNSVILQVLFSVLIGAPTTTSEEMENGGRPIDQSSYFFYQQSEYPRDCAEVMDQCSGTMTSGVYSIKPDGLEAPSDVYCNLDPDDGGWTLIQRRISGQIGFNRSWTEFKNGFGFLGGDFWLGSDRLAYLTNQKLYQLRIDIVTSNGSSYTVSYDSFRISDEWSGYQLLSLGRYNGTADYQQDGCFHSEFGVIQNGTSITNDDCSERCTCEANQLTCDVSYHCDENALCGERNSTRGCYCRMGYTGNGANCTQSTYTDCYDIYTAGLNNSGVYTIKPSDWTGPAFEVFCNMSNGGGWTVFQRRQDGSVDFYRDWNSYKAGFGILTTEHWLGNEKLYYLTRQRGYMMRIDIVNRDGTNYYMNYDTFSIGNLQEEYVLTIGGFTGNTGYDAMAYHNGWAFSTHDNDNDGYSSYNCASYYRGAWWYNNCYYLYYANLNGDYSWTDHTGVAWYNGNTNTWQYQVRYTEMKIRPA